MGRRGALNIYKRARPVFDAAVAHENVVKSLLLSVSTANPAAAAAEY
jgi:hypothetical protein